MGLLKVLFYTFLITFPIAEIGKFQFSNGISFSINDVFLFLLILTWILFKIKHRKTKKYFLKKPILIFVSFGLISLILNFYNLSIDKFIISFLYLLRFASYACIYFIIKEFDLNTKNKISILLLVFGFVTVLIGYAQYFLYPSLRNLFYLGWDEHLYRMFSSFLDPNFAGTFFVLFFIYSIVFVINYFTNKDWIKFIITLLISFLTFVAIYLTYSRSAFIMLIISAIAFLILKGKKKLILLSILVMFSLIFLSPKSFKTEGTNLFRTVSSEARFTSMKQGLYVFTKSPVFGVGFNAYRYAQNKYLGLNSFYWETTHSGAGTDNSFIFVLATTGIVGFVAYIYFLYNIFSLSIINLTKNKYAVCLFSSLLGLVVGSIFINSLFYVFILEWIFVLAGLTENS